MTSDPGAGPTHPVSAQHALRSEQVAQVWLGLQGVEVRSYVTRLPGGARSSAVPPSEALALPSSRRISFCRPRCFGGWRPGLTEQSVGEWPSRDKDRFCERATVSAAVGHLARHRLRWVIDGILLHQLLQWHHMLTSEGCCPATTIAGLEDNTVADGFFHVSTLIALGIGLAMVMRQWQRRGAAPTWSHLIGLVLAGWGLFNLVEGIIDHHILTVHHVRDDVGAPLGWDLAFLAW